MINLQFLRKAHCLVTFNLRRCYCSKENITDNIKKLRNIGILAHIDAGIVEYFEVYFKAHIKNY